MTSVTGIHLHKYIAHDRNKSLYMIFQQHPYEAIRGRYKLVILINREIEITRGLLVQTFIRSL